MTSKGLTHKVVIMVGGCYVEPVGLVQNLHGVHNTTPLVRSIGLVHPLHVIHIGVNHTGCVSPY